MHRVPIDTNILARLATGDSPAEHVAAVELINACTVLILPTVLLETEWVLRAIYGYSPTQFLAFAQWLMEDGNVEMAESKRVKEALRLHGLGFDFADALHLAAAQGEPFATFDKALIRRARSQNIPIKTLTIK